MAAHHVSLGCMLHTRDLAQKAIHWLLIFTFIQGIHRMIGTVRGYKIKYWITAKLNARWSSRLEENSQLMMRQFGYAVNGRLNMINQYDKSPKSSFKEEQCEFKLSYLEHHWPLDRNYFLRIVKSLTTRWLQANRCIHAAITSSLTLQCG